MTRAAPALALALLLSACADEVVAPVGDVEPTTCAGPTWTVERELGFTRWNDTGGAAAESGDVVLVAWVEREENTVLHEIRGLLLDGATGEVRGEVPPVRGDFGDVWVQPVDTGFMVFVQNVFDVVAFHVDRDGGGFARVASYRRGDLLFTAVATDAGVLAFGEDEVLFFNHDGALQARRRDGGLAESICRASTALPDGRVAAWCTDLATGDQLWLTLDAEGQALGTTVVRPFMEWPPRLAASEVGVFVVLPVAEQVVQVALFDPEGVERVAPQTVRLRTVESGDDVGIIGVNACTATCEGLGLAARGNRALLDVSTVFPSRAERFEVVFEDDTLRLQQRGVREVASRQFLTPTTTNPLSVWTRLGPHIPFLDMWPPHVLVVERACLPVSDDVD
jgi:hypothetical protein